MSEEINTGGHRPVTVGELKKLLAKVPDDFSCVITLGDQWIVTAEVDRDAKNVDFGY